MVAGFAEVAERKEILVAEAGFELEDRRGVVGYGHDYGEKYGGVSRADWF
jgi:hypoxanthine-guanine phosphoribosyltransferase